MGTRRRLLRQAVVAVISSALLGSVLAVVPFAAVQVQAAPAPQAAATRPATIAISPASPMLGESVSISGSTGVPAVRPVSIQALRSGTWTTLASARTSLSGHFTATTRWVPGTAIRMVAQAVTVTGKRLPAVTSAIVPVRTESPAVALSGAPDVELSRAATVVATMSNARAGRSVSLQKLTGARWTTLLTRSPGSARTVSFPVPTSALGAVTYRAIVAPWRGAAGATSSAFVITTMTETPPVITSVTPAAGTIAGGTAVTIRGRNLATLTEVSVGGNPGSNLVVLSDTRATLTTPIGTPGSAVVTATNAAGASAPSAVPTFTYDIVDGADEIQYDPAATTHVVESGDLESVHQTAPDPDAADQLTVERHVVALIAGAPVPAVGSHLFIAPGESDLVPQGIAGKVIEVIRNDDGTTSVVVDNAPLDEVIGDHTFDLSGTISDADVDEPSDARSMPGSFVGPVARSSTGLTLGAWSYPASSAAAGSPGGDVARVGLAALGAAALDCTHSGSPVTGPELTLAVSLALENTRVAMTSKSIGDQTFFRATFHTELVLRISGHAGYDLECSLKHSWVDGLKKSFTLSNGLTFSVGPSASMSFSASGDFEYSQMWSRDIDLQQVDHNLPVITNTETAHDPDGSVTLGITAEAKAGARVQVGFLDRLGLYADLKASLKISAQEDFGAGRLCFTFTAGIQLEIGAFLDLWFKNWDVPVIRVVPFSVDTQRCFPTASAPHPDPGAVAGESGLPPNAADPRLGPTSWQDLSGLVTHDLRLESADYAIRTTVTVAVGATLTVPAGARLKIGNCTWTVWEPAAPCLRVNGTLRVEGSGTDPVIFTAYQDDEVGGDTNGAGEMPYPGMWKGIVAGHGATISIDHAFVRYGSEFIIANDNDAHVSLTNSILREGGGIGVMVSNGTATLTADTFTGFRDPVVGGFSDLLLSGATVNGGNVTAAGNATITNNTFHTATLLVNTAGVRVNANAFTGPLQPITASPDGAGAQYGRNVSYDRPLQIMVNGGTLGSDVTWSSAIPFVVQNTVTVPAGRTLTFAAGSIVKFAICRPYNYMDFQPCLMLDGTLDVAGVPGAPVTLTSAYDTSIGGASPDYSGGVGPGNWAGIRSRTGSHVTMSNVVARWMTYFLDSQGDATLSITRATISQSIASSGTLHLESTGATTVRDSSFDHSYVIAMAILPGSPAVIRDTSFQGGGIQTYSPHAVLTGLSFRAGSWGIQADPAGASAPIDAVFAPDMAPGIEVWGYAGTDTVWSNTTMPYIVVSDLTVPAGGHLTIGPGVVVKFFSCGPNYSPIRCMPVTGELDIAGTAAQPVTFTSVYDATVGGQSAAGSPGVSSWQGIVAQNGADIAIDHLDVRYPGTFLTVTGDVPVAISHLRISNAQGQDGVLALGGSAPVTVADSSFSGIGSTAITTTGGTATLSHLTFANVSIALSNAVLGTTLSDSSFTNTSIDIRSPGGPMSAPRNWWGSPAGPVFDGPSANAVGDIDGTPWCLDAGCVTLSGP